MLRATNVVTMLHLRFQTAVVGIAATGATLVIVLGGIDLSVGSIVALTTIVVASLLRGGHSPAVATLAAVHVATMCGTANGLLTAGLKITPFIVTLGTMSVLRGAAKGLASEQKIDADPRGLDGLVLPSRGIAGVPLGVWATLAIAALAAFTVRSTRFGRHVVAIGSNERTARLCGIRVPEVKIAVYAIYAGLLRRPRRRHRVRDPHRRRPHRLDRPRARRHRLRRHRRRLLAGGGRLRARAPSSARS